MATAFTHAFVALAAGKASFRQPMPWKFWVLATVCSAAPDLDIGLHSFGVAYGDLWGHRGMTHSLLFAAFVALFVTFVFFRREAPITTRRGRGMLTFFFLITASHGFIDAFTDGGLGIAFFSPFDTTRYFMPWNPLHVPHFGIRHLFTTGGVLVLLSEFIWVWIPAGIACAIVVILRRAAPDR